VSGGTPWARVRPASGRRNADGGVVEIGVFQGEVPGEHQFLDAGELSEVVRHALDGGARLCILVLDQRIFLQRLTKDGHGRVFAQGLEIGRVGHEGLAFDHLDLDLRVEAAVHVAQQFLKTVVNR
jgi:hypothetical protein